MPNSCIVEAVLQSLEYEPVVLDGVDVPEQKCVMYESWIQLLIVALAALPGAKCSGLQVADGKQFEYRIQSDGYAAGPEVVKISGPVAVWCVMKLCAYKVLATVYAPEMASLMLPTLAPSPMR